MPPDRPHSKDLRKGRCSEPGRAYLITAVTRDRIPVFNDPGLGRHLVRAMIHQHDTGRVNMLAYVIMPDHLHWLIQLTSKTRLECVMQDVKGYSARQINRMLQREGRLWQPGYHDHALRDEEDLVTTARYIVANPLRAGLVQRLGDYPLWDAIWL